MIDDIVHQIIIQILQENNLLVLSTLICICEHQSLYVLYAAVMTN